VTVIGKRRLLGSGGVRAFHVAMSLRVQKRGRYLAYIDTAASGTLMNPLRVSPQELISSTEIVVDDAHVGGRRLTPVHARVNDAPADLGGGLVPQIGGGFQNGSRGIQRAILFRRSGLAVAGAAAFLAEALRRGPWSVPLS